MCASRAIRDLLVVSIGEILWDVIGNQRFVGGAPFNFAYHCRALGAKAALISRVSHDDLGADLIRRAQSLNVDTRTIQRDSDYSTGLVTAEIHSDGTIHYLFPEECAWDHIKFTAQERNLLDFASIVNFGTLALRNPASRSAIMAAVSNLPAGCMAFLDLNLRAPYYSREIISPCLQVADVLKINEDELIVLRKMFQLATDNETGMLQLMERFDIDTIVLTRGDKGAAAVSRREAEVVKAMKVQVADTVGCGDAFAAAFALELATGSSLKDALTKANVVGAYVATHPGGTPDYTQDSLFEFRRETAALPPQPQRPNA